MQSPSVLQTLRCKSKTMNANCCLIKVNRICAWILLVLMIIFFVSGYAWADRIIIPVGQARWMHTQLDTCLVIVFLVHALISTKFALKRRRIQSNALVNITLLIIGMAAFISVLGIKYL